MSYFLRVSSLRVSTGMQSYWLASRRFSVCCVTCTLPGWPVCSILLAMTTSRDHTSYCHLFAPKIPDIIFPECTPIRMFISTPLSRLTRALTSFIIFIMSNPGRKKIIPDILVEKIIKHEIFYFYRTFVSFFTKKNFFFFSF